MYYWWWQSQTSIMTNLILFCSFSIHKCWLELHGPFQRTSMHKHSVYLYIWGIICLYLFWRICSWKHASVALLHAGQGCGAIASTYGWGKRSEWNQTGQDPLLQMSAQCLWIPPIQMHETYRAPLHFTVSTLNAFEGPAQASSRHLDLEWTSGQKPNHTLCLSCGLCICNNQRPVGSWK